MSATIGALADSEPTGQTGVVPEAVRTQDWEQLLAAERHLQKLVPNTVLVGGTAAAMHAGHRSVKTATMYSPTCDGAR